MEQRTPTPYLLPILFDRYKITSPQRGYQLLSQRQVKISWKISQKAQTHILCHYTCFFKMGCPGLNLFSTLGQVFPQYRTDVSYQTGLWLDTALSLHSAACGQGRPLTHHHLLPCRPHGLGDRRRQCMSAHCRNAPPTVSFNIQKDGMSRQKPQLQVRTVFSIKQGTHSLCKERRWTRDTTSLEKTVQTPEWLEKVSHRKEACHTRSPFTCQNTMAIPTFQTAKMTEGPPSNGGTPRITGPSSQIWQTGSLWGKNKLEWNIYD